MSDLQCPAVVLLVAGEILASGDRGPAFSGRRLSGVFVASPLAADPNGLSAAARLARVDGCPVEPLPDAHDGPTLAEAVDHLSDLYRGETIAVVAEAGAIRAALGWPSSPTAPVVVAIDAAGWAVLDRG